MTTRERILAEARLRSESPYSAPPVKSQSKTKPVTWYIAVMVGIVFIGQIVSFYRAGDTQDKVFIMELTMSKFEKELKQNVEWMSDLKKSMNTLSAKLSEDINKITTTALSLNQEMKQNEASLKNDIIRLNEASVTLKNDAIAAKDLMSDILEINSKAANMKCKLKVDEYVTQVGSYLKSFNEDRSDV